MQLVAQQYIIDAIQSAFKRKGIQRIEAVRTMLPYALTSVNGGDWLIINRHYATLGEREHGKTSNSETWTIPRENIDENDFAVRIFMPGGALLFFYTDFKAPHLSASAKKRYIALLDKTIFGGNV